MTQGTYADLLKPAERQHLWAYNALLIVGGSLLIGLFAQIAIPLPFSPVPITGQTLAVLLAGALLGSRRGTLCVLTYIVEGLAGLPVFAGGASGIARLFGATGGYLIGFLVAAYVVGWLAERGWDRQLKTNLLAMVLGNLVIYTCGLLWLGAVTAQWNQVLLLGLYPFLVGDLIKIAIATTLLPAGWRLVRSEG